MKVKYGSSDDIIEIIVRDSSGRKLCHYKANISDKRTLGMIFQTLEAKHSISLPKEREIFEY